MPTIAQQPIDIQWQVFLASSATVYLPKDFALAAAVTLSAANANAPVQILYIQETVNSGTAGSTLPSVRMPGAGINTYVVQLSSAGTIYPLDPTARAAAYALSTANGNADVYVGQVVEVVTAP